MIWTKGRCKVYVRGSLIKSRKFGCRKKLLELLQEWEGMNGVEISVTLNDPDDVLSGRAIGGAAPKKKRRDWKNLGSIEVI